MKLAPAHLATYFLVFFAAFAAPPPALAQTISQPQANGTVGNRTGHGLGQSFTATLTGYITAIDVNSQDAWTADLYLYNGGAGSGVANSVGTPDFTQAGVSLTGDGNWDHIVLATPFPVVAGNQYTFQLTVPSGGPSFWYLYGYGGTDVYAGGEPIYDYASFFSPFQIVDLAFQVYEAVPGDLAIALTDGATTATAGGTTTYTITASNLGSSNATGVTVTDTFPASVTGVTWSCAGAGGGTCAASGSGNINDTTANLPAGSSVTYTATATIDPAATGGLSTTANISSWSIVDTNPANNSATDTDTITKSADLSVTKTDGVTTAVPGGSVTYTITASNAGPSNASGATVADTFPNSLTVSWTCVGAGGGTCTGSGSGNINDTTVNLPSGGSVTYTASATISASATGTLSNTATVSVPGGVTDPNPANNSATDTDTLTPQADLAITKTDGVAVAFAGGSVVYTITASNAGPSNASGATVADSFPAPITGVSWTCVGAGGGTCTVSGSGNIGDPVDLPAGGSVTYTATASINLAAAGTMSNTATVTAPAGVTDPTPGNNSATDTDALALNTFSGPSATGSGTITATFAGAGACTFSAPQFIGPPPGAPPIPPSAPPGAIFPHGLFAFSVTGCAVGQALVFSITYPQALPPGTHYFKYGPTSANPAPHWYVLPATIAGNTATFTIVDGGLGDDDLTPNGVIVDAGGPGAGGFVAPVPTLDLRALILLALLMGTAAAVMLRRRS